MPDQKNVQANTQLPSLPDALCDLLHEGSFNHAAAVGIYLCHLEETISHPHDSAWRDDQLEQLQKALGESSQAVQSQARSLFAAKCLCRLLQLEEASVGPDDVTTIECSSQMDELKGLMDAFGWGFPFAEPAEQVASVHNPFRECDDVYDAAAGAVRAINARLARRGLQLVSDDAEALRVSLVGGLQDSEVEEAQ